MRAIPVSRASPRGRSRPRYLLEAGLECGEIADLGVIGGHRTLLVTGPALIQHIFERNAGNYSKKTGPSRRSSRLLLGDGLLASENDTNRERRKLMSGMLRREALTAMYDVMAAVARERIEAWRRRGDAPFEIDVAEQMRDLSQQIVVRTLLSGEERESTQRACAAWKTISDYVGRSYLAKRPIPLFVPTADNLRYRRALAELETAVSHMIDGCREGRAAGTLLSIVVSALDRGEMTRSAVRDEITNMFLAGQESVSATLTWTWYLLSRAPAVRRAVEAELSAVTGGAIPAFGQLSELRYLQRVIAESLRLYPPGWLIDRLAIGSDDVDGYHIPAGSMVLVSQFVSHRLPGRWENPEGFDPDRFVDEARISPYVYFPWGIGPYVCYGKAFALIELKLVLASLAQNFRLSVRPGLDAVEATPSIAFRPRYGLPMVVEWRTS